MKNEFLNPLTAETIQENVLQNEKDKHLEMLGNLQSVFGLSEDELTSMINGEHFNHQYKPWLMMKRRFLF